MLPPETAPIRVTSPSPPPVVFVYSPPGSSGTAPSGWPRYESPGRAGEGERVGRTACRQGRSGDRSGAGVGNGMLTAITFVREAAKVVLVNRSADR
jgi:hypothetical protein